MPRANHRPLGSGAWRAKPDPAEAGRGTSGRGEGPPWSFGFRFFAMAQLERRPSFSLRSHCGPRAAALSLTPTRYVAAGHAHAMYRAEKGGGTRAEGVGVGVVSHPPSYTQEGRIYESL